MKVGSISDGLKLCKSLMGRVEYRVSHHARSCRFCGNTGIHLTFLTFRTVKSKEMTISVSKGLRY
jgi:hypothetical protein